MQELFSITILKRKRYRVYSRYNSRNDIALITDAGHQSMYPGALIVKISKNITIKLFQYLDHHP